MGTQPLRIGIAGTGMAGKYHYECLQRIYGVPVEVIGVIAKTPKSSRCFAKERGITPFNSYEEMLEKIG